MDDKKLWELKFQVEVSARYHDWRRATLEGWARVVRAISLLGASLALTFAFDPFDFSGTTLALVVGGLSAAIAIVNLAELVFGVGAAARKHGELYKRFQALQADILRYESEWEKRHADWAADAQEIRIDEPPTMWAVYAMCWNQTIDRHDVGEGGHYRKIGPIRMLLRNIKHYRPQDFPSAPVRT